MPSRLDKQLRDRSQRLVATLTIQRHDAERVVQQCGELHQEGASHERFREEAEANERRKHNKCSTERATSLTEKQDDGPVDVGDCLENGDVLMMEERWKPSHWTAKQWSNKSSIYMLACKS